MRARDRIVEMGTGLSVLLLGLACSIPNPAYDELEVADALEDEPLEGAEGGRPFEDEPAPNDEPGGGGDGPADPEDPDEPGGDDGAGEEESDVLLLYSSLDAFEAVIEPEVGAGLGLLSDPAPELTSGVQDKALRTTSGSQWFAFPQHDGSTANIDHAAGLLEFDLRVEFEPPHLGSRDLVSLAGVLADGGGIRFGVSDLFDGNRLRVEYIDASSELHLTRFPAGLLPPGEWVHVELSWRADVEPQEPNVELWIDGEWIEPLFGYAAGSKQIGSASPEDVMVFGSWALGNGDSAEASFDEIQIWRG